MSFRDFLKPTTYQEKKPDISDDVRATEFINNFYKKYEKKAVYFNPEVHDIKAFRNQSDTLNGKPSELKQLKDQYALLIDNFTQWCDDNKIECRYETPILGDDQKPILENGKPLITIRNVWKDLFIKLFPEKKPGESFVSDVYFGHNEAADVFNTGKRNLEKLFSLINQEGLSYDKKKIAIKNLVERLPYCIAGISTEIDEQIKSLLQDQDSLIQKAKIDIINQSAKEFFKTLYPPEVIEELRNMEIHYVNKLRNTVAEKYGIPKSPPDRYESVCDIDRSSLKEFEEYLENPRSFNKAQSTHNSTIDTFLDLYTQEFEAKMREVKNYHQAKEFFKYLTAAVGPGEEKIGALFGAYEEKNWQTGKIKIETDEILEVLAPLDEIHSEDTIETKQKKSLVSQHELQARLKSIVYLRLVASGKVNESLYRAIDFVQTDGSEVSAYCLPSHPHLSFVKISAKDESDTLLTVREFLASKSTSEREVLTKALGSKILWLDQEYADNPAKLLTITSKFSKIDIVNAITEGFIKEDVCIALLLLDKDIRHTLSRKFESDVSRTLKKQFSPRLSELLHNLNTISEIDIYEIDSDKPYVMDIQNHIIHTYLKRHYPNLDALSSVEFKPFIINDFIFQTLLMLGFREFSNMDLTKINFQALNDAQWRAVLESNFTGANFTGKRTRLSGINIAKNFTYITCARLENTNMQNVQLVDEAVFVPQPGMQIDYVTLKSIIESKVAHSNLYKSDNYQINIPRNKDEHISKKIRLNDLRYVKLVGDFTSLCASESPISLSGFMLSGEHIDILYKSGLRDFRGVICEDIKLTNLNLSGANFNGAKFCNCDFSGANLVKTDFLKAEFSGENIFHHTIYANTDAGDRIKFIKNSDGDALSTCKRLLEQYIKLNDTKPSIFKRTKPEIELAKNILAKLDKEPTKYHDVPSLMGDHYDPKKVNEVNSILQFCWKMHYGIGEQNKEYKQEKEHKERKDNRHGLR